MFDAKQDKLSERRAYRYAITQYAAPLRYGDVIALWQHSVPFRSFFLSLLKDVPFSAYRWETPPVTARTVRRPFEFVLLDSPDLARPPDAGAFTAHFSDADAKVVVFENIGKDATLVVPSPRGPAAAYGHLAAFTRQAPESQNHALWQTVGEAMQQRLADRPLWLSTAGGGVAWLHVRLDVRPKYYRYGPYRASA